jgi:hypothetical protein
MLESIERQRADSCHSHSSATGRMAGAGSGSAVRFPVMFYLVLPTRLLVTR